MDNSVISQWQKTNLPKGMETVLICAVVWVIYPALATPFFITQIAGYAFILGIICLSFFPTYGAIITFVIMVGILAWKPQGIFGGQHG